MVCTFVRNVTRASAGFSVHFSSRFPIALRARVIVIVTLYNPGHGVPLFSYTDTRARLTGVHTRKRRNRYVGQSHSSSERSWNRDIVSARRREIVK